MYDWLLYSIWIDFGLPGFWIWIQFALDLTSDDLDRFRLSHWIWTSPVDCFFNVQIMALIDLVTAIPRFLVYQFDDLVLSIYFTHDHQQSATTSTTTRPEE